MRVFGANHVSSARYSDMGKRICGTLTAAWALWNFLKLAVAVNSCLHEDDLPTDGSAHVDLTLTCNATHLLYSANIVQDHQSFYYSYFLHLDCFDANGSQSFNYTRWNGIQYTGFIHFTNTCTLTPETECTLYGCYREIGSKHTFYAVHPVQCTVDVDECLLQTHTCSDWALCTNTVGSYNCSCLSGYSGDGTNCTDIDECASGAHVCSDVALCLNAPGSYNCSCLDGYDGDGFNCTDMNECLLRTHTCSDWAFCTNTVGSYNCSCWPGYSGDGATCTDIDECASGAHVCSDVALCLNTPGSYNCSCLDGYDGDGFNCTDVDECLLHTHTCSDWALCTNTVGGYNCSCLRGYSGDGAHCTDIDECVSGVCSDVALCLNTLGSYNCSCIDGYDGDGFNCTDGCLQDTSNCSPHARCVDSGDGYRCRCEDTYEGDGYNCTAKGHQASVTRQVLSSSIILLLCLAIPITVGVLILFMNKWRKKPSWLYHFKREWEEQELDKDFHPVDPAVVLSGSLRSVIEPLWDDNMTPPVTTDSASQTTSDASDYEHLSSSTSTEKDFDGDRGKEDVVACCSEQVTLTTSTLHGPKADHSLMIQSCTSEPSNSAVCSFDSSLHQIPATAFELDSSTFTKDESGFMSDTSSSVYLSFYQLSNKL